MKKIHIKTLKEISGRNPYTSQIIKKENTFPTLQIIIDKALESENTSIELKNKLLNLKNTEILNKTREVEDLEMIKKAEDWLDAEIDKYISEGKLPKIIKNKKIK